MQPTDVNAKVADWQAAKQESEALGSKYTAVCESLDELERHLGASEQLSALRGLAAELLSRLNEADTRFKHLDEDLDHCRVDVCAELYRLLLAARQIDAARCKKPATDALISDVADVVLPKCQNQQMRCDPCVDGTGTGEPTGMAGMAGKRRFSPALYSASKTMYLMAHPGQSHPLFMG